MKNQESKLQIECVKWFRLQYPQYASLLFAIPNGGKRNIITATIQKREGVLAGVADLFLAMPHFKPTAEFDSIYSGLFIEMKFGKGKQSDAQYAFENAVLGQCFAYELIYDFDTFKEKIEAYIQD